MHLDLYIRTYIAEMLKHCSKQLHTTIITIITSYLLMKCRLVLKIITETCLKKKITQSSSPVQYSSPVVQSSEWIHLTRYKHSRLSH